MNLPYFPLYVGDFEADTSHLTPEQDGVYNRLLRAMWRSPNCALAYDEADLRRRLRLTAQQWKRSFEPLVRDGLVRIEGGLVTTPALQRWQEMSRRATPRPWVPLDIQRAVKARDVERCVYCGSDCGPFHLDHLYPWARGGEHSVENLVVACASCNWSKGALTVAEWQGAVQ